MSEAQNVYLRLKGVFGNADARAARWRQKKGRSPGDDDEANVPYGKGRDPRGLGDVMAGLESELGWTSSLAKSDLLLAWKEIAGPDTADADRHHRLGADRAMRLHGVGDPAAAHACAHHDDDRSAVPRRGHRVDPLRSTPRPVVETGLQIDSRPGSSRYLRLTGQMWSTSRNKHVSGASEGRIPPFV